MVLMCLGSEAVVSIRPKSGFRELPLVPESSMGPGSGAGPDPLTGLPDMDVDMPLDGLLPMDVDIHTMDGDGDEVMRDLEAECEAEEPHAVVPATVPSSAPAIEEVTATRKPKPPKENISVTLLHGDAMLLSGDDFEVGCFFCSLRVAS